MGCMGGCDSGSMEMGRTKRCVVTQLDPLRVKFVGSDLDAPIMWRSAATEVEVGSHAFVTEIAPSQWVLTDILTDQPYTDGGGVVTAVWFAVGLPAALGRINPDDPGDESGDYGLVGDLPPRLTSPNGIGYGDGRWLVVEPFGDELWRINPDSPGDESGDYGLVGDLPSGLTSPNGIGYGDGRWLVVDTTGDELWRINPDSPGDESGDYGLVGSLPSGLTNPRGIGYGDGRWLVVDNTGDELWRINPDSPGDESGDYGLVGSLPSGLTNPRGIGYGDGRWLVVDSTGATLWRINPDNPGDESGDYGLVGDLPSGFTNPNGISSGLFMVVEGAPPVPSSATVDEGSVTFGGITSYYGEIEWVAGTGGGEVTGFEIARGFATPTTDFTSLTVVGSDAVSYKDWTVARGANYVYRVRAIGPGGESAWRGGVGTAVIPSLPSVVAPSVPSSATVDEGSVTFGGITSYYGEIEWVAGTGGGEVTGFEIARGFATPTTDFTSLTVVGSDAVSYKDWTVARGANYVYRVRAIGPGGESAWRGGVGTAVIPSLPSVVAPSVPSSATVDEGSVTFGGITSYYGEIEWVAGTGGGEVTGFEIARGFATPTTDFTSLTVVGSDAVSYKDWTVARGANYVYRVRAIGPGGESAWRGGVGTAVIPSLPSVVAPSVPSSATVDEGSVTFGGITSYYGEIEWVAGTGGGEVTGFEIARGFATPTTDFTSLTVVGSDAVSYKDWTVARGANYVYRVRAIGPGGESAWRGGVGTAVIPSLPSVVAPGSPSNVTMLGQDAFGNLDPYVSVFWDAPTVGGEVSGYEIERKSVTSPPQDPWGLAGTSVAGVTVFNDLGAVSGSTYNYRVTSFGPGGTGGPVQSADTVTVPLTATTTAPGSVTNVDAILQTHLGDDNLYVTVDWDAPVSGGEVTGYQIERRVTNGSPGELYQPVGSQLRGITVFSDTSVFRGREYNYRVRAVGPGGDGDYGVDPDNILIPSLPSEAVPAVPASATVDEGSVTFGGIATWYGEIEWVAGSGGGQVTGYEVRRAFAVPSPGFFSLATVGPDITTFQDWTVARGVNYVYGVRAVGPGGESAWRGGVGTAVIPPPQLPTEVRNLIGRHNADEQNVETDWDEPEEGDPPIGYIVDLDR